MPICNWPLDFPCVLVWFFIYLSFYNKLEEICHQFDHKIKDVIIKKKKIKNKIKYERVSGACMYNLLFFTIIIIIII
jgi:hypothetical protein